MAISFIVCPKTTKDRHEMAALETTDEKTAFTPPYYNSTTPKSRPLLSRWSDFPKNKALAFGQDKQGITTSLAGGGIS
jgi:hypothetical protein